MEKLDIIVATGVKFGAGRLAGHRLVERDERHATLGAEAFVFAGRVPAWMETLRRENDPASAGETEGASHRLFERAHESGNACSAGSLRPPRDLGIDEEDRVVGRRPVGESVEREGGGFRRGEIAAIIWRDGGGEVSCRARRFVVNRMSWF